MKYFLYLLTAILFSLHSNAQNSTKIIKASSISKYRAVESPKPVVVAKKKDMNDPVVQYETGMNYMYGKGGVEMDEITAIKWLRKSADQGNRDAQFEMGVAYYWGFKRTTGIDKDLKISYEYLLKAANQGHVGAQTWIGDMHEKGKGTVKDWDKAVYWYKKAAAQGDEGSKKRLQEAGLGW